jgi:acetylornithine deacetylase
MALISERDILDLLRELVRIPSVNPSLAPDEGHGEQAIATFAAEWLNARGVHAWIEEAEPGRPNAVAEVGNGEPTLVLCAHLDTVGTAGMDSPFEPRVENGRVYGRGSYDMKGSAAAIMATAVALERTGLNGRVLVALVADEEYASLGAMDFVSRHRADGCIVTEPADGTLVLAHKGFVWARITTTGRAAHGSRWDLGVSAIGKMGRIIAALEEFDRNNLRIRVHPLVGPASMHCALVGGGTGLSTYASQCRLDVERRTLPGETAPQVTQELEEIILRSGEDASVECRFDRPPLMCDPESVVARAVREAIAGVTGHHAPEAGVQFWMDAAIFANAGVPTVNYGPTGAGAHEVVEWVEVDSVVSCANVLAQAATLFCQQTGTPNTMMKQDDLLP